MAAENEELTEEQAYDKEYDEVFHAEENEAPASDTPDEALEESTEEESTEPVAKDDEAPTPGVKPEPSEDGEPEEKGGDPKGDPEAGEAAPELVTLKWRGQTIQATQDEVIAMAQKNFDATHKWQEVSDLRKSTKADLDLLERARKGDKSAISAIISQAEVDPVDLLDVDPEDSEQGKPDQAEPFVSPEVSNMLDEVAQDPELFESLKSVEDDLPQGVIDKMAKDPETFYTIVSEVRSGDAKLVLPEVRKAIALMDGVDRNLVTSNVDAYANLYLNVKNRMIAAAQPASGSNSQKKVSNANELSIKKSGGTKRKAPTKTDSFNSDDAYQAILDRMNQGG